MLYNVKQAFGEHIIEVFTPEEDQNAKVVVLDLADNYGILVHLRPDNSTWTLEPIYIFDDLTYVIDYRRSWTKRPISGVGGNVLMESLTAGVNFYLEHA